MNKYRIKILIIILLYTFFAIGIEMVEATNIQNLLTQEERDYIEELPSIRAVSIKGGAPLHYVDGDGEIRGIAIQVIEQISNLTGLHFEYELFDSVQEALDSDGDILFGVTYDYVPEKMTLSDPYLESEVILFTNSDLASKDLDNKIYAGLRGGKLPKGVTEDKVIYYNNREETLNAVEKGEADYGYGNAYSVAYYILRNNYKNLVTIPIGKGLRKYAIGFPEENPILLSIINKGLAEIDEQQIHTIILDVASHIDRKVTLPIIIGSYGSEIVLIIFCIIAILSWSVVSNIRSNNQLRMQNKRYEILSQISNEYFYEYYLKNNYLELSKKSMELFGDNEPHTIIKTIKNKLTDKKLESNTSIIELPLPNGVMGVFRMINTNLYDERDRVYSIIGKLIDISEEFAEKKELIHKARTDGLTGLYNTQAARKLIEESMEERAKDSIDAFIILDCDKFKEINDTYGHLKGNMVLEKIAEGLKNTFRQTDIIGRIGGDEFCVYMKNIPSQNFVGEKCQQFTRLLKDTIEEFDIFVSIGVALLKDNTTYDELFKEADYALYQAKARGKGQLVIYNELE